MRNSIVSLKHSPHFQFRRRCIFCHSCSHKLLTCQAKDCKSKWADNSLSPDTFCCLTTEAKKPWWQGGIAIRKVFARPESFLSHKNPLSPQKFTSVKCKKKHFCRSILNRTFGILELLFLINSVMSIYGKMYRST